MAPALLAVAWVGLGAALIVQRLRGALRVLALGAGLGTALLAIAVVGVMLGAERSFGPSGLDSADLAYARGAPFAAKALASSAPPQKGAAGEAALTIGGPSNEGLPARIEIPPGARQTGFNRELLATDAPRSVLAVLVAARVVSALAGAAALLFLAVAFTFRRDLAAGARVLAARALGSAAHPGPGA